MGQVEGCKCGHVAVLHRTDGSCHACGCSAFELDVNWAENRGKRDDAIIRADEGAADGFHAEARSIILARILPKGEPFTSDDVWPHITVETPEHRAMGPVFQSLSREGLIEPTGRYVPCRRKSRNVAPVREWRGVSKEALR